MQMNKSKRTVSETTTVADLLVVQLMWRRVGGALTGTSISVSHVTCNVITHPMAFHI